ncbi:uncharacterized protein FIESC28_01431 [Fusarium coffeatum]|uniref:Aminoglycoside phosphotransferase domain-containing protein n=1 Tax=Fusarium coffeatum TaxID=231269 RepID=A0A366S8Y6_9HYPO|nr:uncharacterized protein FIESC28_01431 [Fusarium coffeatum]RBR25749.1 hypothetical protein FIESC28_01431 [Fusarium coffeatum]
MTDSCSGSHKPDLPSEEKSIARRQIDDNSWLIGGVVISRHASEPSGPCWGDGKGGFFTISEAPNPRPTTRPISKNDDCPIEDHLLLEPSSYNIYQVGLAFLAIDDGKGTPEHITLEALAKIPLSFQIPKVYYHGVHDDRYYIVYSALPGKTICEAWPETNDDALKERWLEQIVDSCVELSALSSQAMTGITGDTLAEWWLSRDFLETSVTPESLLQTCKEIGMDCSNLVFQQNDLSPLAFTVDESGKLLGIYHWGDAGFLPKDWILTKATSNPHLKAWNRQKAWKTSERNKWSMGIKGALQERGFRERFEANGEWREKVFRDYNVQNMRGMQGMQGDQE